MFVVESLAVNETLCSPLAKLFKLTVVGVEMPDSLTDPSNNKLTVGFKILLVPTSYVTLTFSISPDLISEVSKVDSISNTESLILNENADG